MEEITLQAFNGSRFHYNKFLSMAYKALWDLALGHLLDRSFYSFTPLSLLQPQDCWVVLCIHQRMPVLGHLSLAGGLSVLAFSKKKCLILIIISINFYITFFTFLYLILLDSIHYYLSNFWHQMLSSPAFIYFFFFASFLIYGCKAIKSS